MEDFFTKVPNYSIETCEKPFPFLIDFDLKHCIKTETFKNLRKLSSGKGMRTSPTSHYGEPYSAIEDYEMKGLMPGVSHDRLGAAAARKC